MTRILLRRSVITVMVVLSVLMVIVAYAHFHSPSNIGCVRGVWGEPCWLATYSFLKDFSAVIIAIPAAWLAYCFNRRNSFLTTLNDLWKGMVTSKNLCVKYTLYPSTETYVDAWLSLSSSIDSMRSVYRNVGEDKSSIGFFPFEPLHDMRKILERLKIQLDDETTRHSRKQLREDARTKLLEAWDGLRSRFLLEFGAPFPSMPITTFGFQDERRSRRAAGEAIPD